MQMRRVNIFIVFIVALGLAISGVGGSTVGRHPPGVDVARLTARITDSSPAVKAVQFGGYTIDIPRGWPVYELGRNSTTCVNYDRNALYLGVPGLNQDCGAHVVGRVATISLQLPSAAGQSPAGQSPAGLPGGGPAVGTGYPASDLPAVSSLPRVGTSVRGDAQDHELYAAVGGTGLSVSATYGSDAGSVLTILRTLRRTSSQPATAGQPVPAGQPAGVPADGGAMTRTSPRPARANTADWHITGKAFDTCATPSLGVMQAWNHAFSDVGVYIGGAEISCPYGNLSASWVQSAVGLGWGLIPIYVGAQASCDKQFTVRIHPNWATAEGQAAAGWAVEDAAALGMGRGTPIYYDMESFNINKATCRSAVLAFLSGWTTQIHALGYVSGVYSSASTGAEALGFASALAGHPVAEPDSIWFALWDGQANLSGLPYLAPGWWVGYQRLKQYLGAHNRTVNGFTVNIDSDLIRGPVYR
jgi:glycoside hydrolase-like protein